MHERRRWVIKVGSALLADADTGLDVSRVKELARQIHILRENKVEVVLVSSGAVASGMMQFECLQRPEKLSELQAFAAVGQARLIQEYQNHFAPYGIRTAQVLLTHADIQNRQRYLNAKATLKNLFGLDVLTIVNENDSVATEEICFGDNDAIAALVCNLVDAKQLVILTDQEGLFSSDPRSNLDAELIVERHSDDITLDDMVSTGGQLGRGGMITKLSAARTAAKNGATTIIANGATDNVLVRLAKGEKNRHPIIGRCEASC